MPMRDPPFALCPKYDVLIAHPVGTFLVPHCVLSWLPSTWEVLTLPYNVFSSMHPVGGLVELLSLALLSLGFVRSAVSWLVRYLITLILSRLFVGYCHQSARCPLLVTPLRRGPVQVCPRSRFSIYIRPLFQSYLWYRSTLTSLICCSLNSAWFLALNGCYSAHNFTVWYSVWAGRLIWSSLSVC